MKRLQENRIELLSNYLKKSGLSPELLPEILDHLACEAEERLWDGDSFERAFSGIVETADPDTLHILSVEHNHLLAMEKTLNDIVFENRNKSYGAYQLRKGYGQTMQKSVLIGVALFLVMVMLPNLYARLKPKPKATDVAFVVAELEDVNIKPEAKPLPPPVEAPKPVEKTIKSKLLEVVPDEKVDVDYTPPTTDELEHAKPAQQTIEGVEGLDDVTPPAVSGAAVKPNVVEVLPEKEFGIMLVDQKPEFAGGNAGMAAFLQKNLKYPSAAVRANIQGRVFVQFTVGTDGRIENVTPIKGIGFGCDEEAVRVIKLMPEWKPGKQGGVPVRVKFTLPIVFQME